MLTKATLVVTAILTLALSATAHAQSAPGGVKTASVNSQSIFVDSKGMTLYTFDYDTTAGKSACNDRCATAWPPLAAAADAKAMGPWSVITRDDGTKQWAYKDKPLYTFSRDAAAGDAKGDNMGQNGSHIWHVVPAG